MAQMSIYSESRSCLLSWIGAPERDIANAAMGRRFIVKWAAEQRANLEALKYDLHHYGRTPSWCRIDEYERSVRMWEVAALFVAMGRDAHEIAKAIA